MSDTSFIINAPSFDVATGRVTLGYDLGDLSFTETLDLPHGFNEEVANTPSFTRLLDLTAAILGTSYFKLQAPFAIDATALALDTDDIALIQDVYENGLAEFYARNDLKRFGKLNIEAGPAPTAPEAPILQSRILLPIGGGKDSLVSVQLLEKSGVDFTPFAVNPKGPILTSVEAIGRDPLYVKRTLDAEMIRLGQEPGYYNGHVPSTAINSIIASLVALLFGYETIALSNERSASEGNAEFDGREVNHQHSKSLDFEKLFASALARATGGALTYFSLLRPYSEARIAALFARETKFDLVFSSCNANFRLAGHEGDLWCGTCPKCLFTFLILAPHMPKSRLAGLFSQNVLDNPDNETGYRELIGLAGQKPWECVGEILEAAACLWAITKLPDWRQAKIVTLLKDELETHYGINALEEAYRDLHQDAPEHLIPKRWRKRLRKMQLDQPVLLYGAGREARSTRAFLKKHFPDCLVLFTADSGDAEIEDATFISPEELSAAIANKQFATIVKSPGVSLYKPIFDEARKAGIAITSNLNIWASHFASGRKTIAITGTKGKSTTATLVHLMLTHSGLDTGLGGNVGLPPLELADRFDIVVLELSSYQTADMDFTPNLVGITNLTPEHVDWHGSVERYYVDKLNLIDRDGDFAVALGPGLPTRLEVEKAFHHDTGRIPLLDPISTDAVTQSVAASRLKGAHNLDNAILAARLALAAGATLDGILAGIVAFAPLPHRLEEHKFDGLTVVNDSISTTPEATKAALNAYKGNKIALIAGGHERQQNYQSLAEMLATRGVELLICLPQTGTRLAACARAANPDLKISEVPDLQTAMEFAKAQRGTFDTLILSPGAPSYNQFTNFEERGKAFLDLANRLLR